MTTTKQCIKCKQDIHLDANICQHCHSNQSKYHEVKGGIWFVVLIGIIVSGIMLIKISETRTSDDDVPVKDTSAITIKNVTHGFGVTFERLQDKTFYDIYVVAEIENGSKVDLTSISLQFLCYDENNVLIDVVNGGTGPIKVGGKKIIKVNGRAIKPQASYKSVLPVILIANERRSA